MAPLDYASVMDVEAVSYTEAAELGLVLPQD